MKNETKLFIGIILGTITIVAAGVLLLSRSGTSGSKADSSILIRADSNKIASGSGTVTLVEFSDFQCPACGAYYAPVKQLVNEFASSMTFVYRNFPLTTVHKNAQLAAQAAEAAGLQGKFWEMHDRLFETQSDWSASDKARDIFIGYAETLKLDKAQFTNDLDSDAVKNKVAEDVNDGNVLAVNSTPTFFLDGTKLDNPANFADFEALVKAEIQNAPKPASPSQGGPTVTKTEAYHIHANFKVFVNGTALDFSSKKEENEFIHVHDGKGDLIHIHKQGMTLGDFFTSLKMDFSGNVKLFVNGKEHPEFLKYVPQDLDKILITDGPIVPVADDACIYSLKCPSRGTPPTENCVGGLGTGCKE